MKTNELIGPALDWAAAKANSIPPVCRRSLAPKTTSCLGKTGSRLQVRTSLRQAGRKVAQSSTKCALIFLPI